jgi:hypothetical protein
MKKIARLLTLATPLLACSAFAEVDNSYIISPPVVHFQFTRTHVQNYFVVNKGDNTIRLSVKPIFYGIGDKGGPFANDKVLVDNGKSYSLLPYMKVSPKTLVIPAHASRTVRLQVAKPTTPLSDGTYEGYVFYQITPPKPQEHRLGRNEKGVEVELGLVFDEAAGVVATVGKGTAQGVTMKCQMTPNHLFVIAKNPSTYQFRPLFNVKDASGKTIQKNVPIIPILPNSIAKHEIDLPDAIRKNTASISWSENDKNFTAQCNA